MKRQVLFICTGNSCRSQMAEGLTRHIKGDEIEASSAGVDPKGIDPKAIKAMAEIGIDISNQESRSIDALKDRGFDYVISLCDSAQKNCPSFPARTKVIHVGFEDPPKLAATARTEEEAMMHYRRIRDEIQTFVEKMPEVLLDKGGHEQHFQAGIEGFLADLPDDLSGREE